MRLDRIAVALGLFLALGFGCSGKKPPVARDAGKGGTFDRETSMARARLAEGRWETTRSIELVDPAVLGLLKPRFGKDDRLARAGEPLDWTGVSDHAPRRPDLGGRV